MARTAIFFFLSHCYCLGFGSVTFFFFLSIYLFGGPFPFHFIVLNWQTLTIIVILLSFYYQNEKIKIKVCRPLQKQLRIFWSGLEVVMVTLASFNMITEPAVVCKKRHECEFWGKMNSLWFEVTVACTRYLKKTTCLQRDVIEIQNYIQVFTFPMLLPLIYIFFFYNL